MVSSGRSGVIGFLALLVLVTPATSRADESAVWVPSSHAAVAAAFAQQPPSEDPAEQQQEQQQQPLSIPTSPAADSQPGPEPHPAPAHTGFAALGKDTLSDFIAFPKRRSTWVILAIGAGVAAIGHPADDNLNAHISGSHAAKVFFAPGKIIGSAYFESGVALGLYAIGRWVVPRKEGVDQTNKWSHLGFDLLRAQIVSQAFVQGIKYSVQRDRPTGECCSFPSGHAATAFAVASVLERHLGYRLAWPTVVGATYVAVSRLHDNRHFLSDVLFGSAIGTATGWTVVGRHGRDTYVMVPTPVPGGVALMMTRNVR